MQQGYNVGYIKPLGTIPIKKGPDVYDEDAVFIKAALGLSDSLNIISPFILATKRRTVCWEVA